MQSSMWVNVFSEPTQVDPHSHPTQDRFTTRRDLRRTDRQKFHRQIRPSAITQHQQNTNKRVRNREKCPPR